MIIKRRRMFMTNEECERIRKKKRVPKKIRITAAEHGMKCYEARGFKNNIINIARTASQLAISHEYNHGTAIKEMLAQNFSNDHIYEQFPDPRNQGVTHMLIDA